MNAIHRSFSSFVSSLVPLPAALLLAFGATAVQAQIIKEPFVPLPRFTIILPNPEDFSSITAGNNHTCVTKNNGNTYCWGRNDLGQAGGYSTGSVNRPRFVMNFMSVDAGHTHTCGVDWNGLAYCWGDNGYGQLGIGSYGYQQQPIAVAGGQKFRMISAGQGSTCGTTANGVFCWGVIQNGWSGVPTPQQVFAFSGYDHVSVGYNSACAVYRSGGFGFTDCWGNNRYGQIGIDPAVLQIVPPTVGTSFTPDGYRVQAQSYYTCVSRTAGGTQCAGWNGWGQLGNGNTTTTWQAQNVGGGMALHSVTTGSNHACALDPSGRAFCWGNGYWGQLGNGTSTVFTTPQPVAGGLTFRAIAAGERHTCAIGTNNAIYCWGANDYAQLGMGVAGSWYWTPVQAATPQ
jgi:alpha-tubulin suppressor-like RCC1 family protein